MEKNKVCCQGKKDEKNLPMANCKISVRNVKIKELIKKKVQLNDNLQIHLYDKFDDYEKADRGEWQQAAIDREHFRFRIERVGKIINPVLEKHLLNYMLNKIL